ncbi:leucine-rich repeat domain-containing protein [Candidatus Palauibacter sp.]|uniref:leucine-rich repeat domain-containing protein n=1 Tax=Candidatus Palauibacter sp. TaxID=3101350 RepID=UPI003B59C37D
MAKRIRTTSGSSDFSRSSRARTARSAVLGLLGLAILSCGGGDTAGPPPGPPPPPPTANVPARITLDPETVAVVAGDTIRVRARVLNDRAQPISDAVVTWASSDPATATVDATGLVTGLKEGNASLTATSGPVSNSAPVAVHSLDRATLMDLYVGTRGLEWTNNDGWGTDAPVGSWYGVTANADSRVTALNLRENGLNGQLPADLGSLAFLTELVVDANENLSGPIPSSLSALGIETLNYGGTMLCTVRDEGFQAWLNAVPTREGEFLACNEERSDLVKLYEAMGGESWTESANWGTDAPLENWFGISVDDSTGRVTSIDLNRNNLSGTIPSEIQYFPSLRELRLDYNRLEDEIPAEIGLLTELRRMDIDGNDFTGSIPPEIGNLTKLEVLWMGGNQMSGPIPPEFGNLASLEVVHLYEAPFDGSIPEEIGNLSELRRLRIAETEIDGPLPASLGALEKLRILQVYESRVSGPIPAAIGQIDSLWLLELSNNEIDGSLPGELGQLDSLQIIAVDGNMLSGALPPGLGDAGALEILWLQNNPDLSGPLPESMTQLEELFELVAFGTGLCMPQTSAFRTWLESALPKYRIRTCGGEAHAEAYLIQAAQSREFPVPLVAGREALLRVFVTSEQETGAMLPPVRATFFVEGAEVHVEHIPAGSSEIPTEVQEGELDLSPHAVISADVIQPGLEMVVEIDPDGTLDPNLGVSKRIPETGRTAVDVKAVPPLLLTLIPFVRTADNDRAAVSFVVNADADDEFFFPTRTYLPVGELEIIRHEDVTVDATSMLELRDRVGAIRVMEDGIGHWLGLTATAIGNINGVATLPFFTDSIPYNRKAAVSRLNGETVAHELGHNLSLFHVLCRGDEGGPDPSYPYENGESGVWGYDFRDGGSLVPPDRLDFMSYCDPAWVSDYYFSNALRFRLQDTLEVWRPPAASRTLLVSGGVSGDGEPWLDPAFVVDTRPVVPHAGGPWQLNGRRADGSELFSLSFQMVEVWDGDGGGAFTFALPVQADWATELASLSVSGPTGSFEMTEGSAPPMAILRDPDTGTVRAIFTDLPSGPLARSAAEDLAPEPGLEVLVSSGLPGASAWRR